VRQKRERERIRWAKPEIWRQIYRERQTHIKRQRERKKQKYKDKERESERMSKSGKRKINRITKSREEKEK
jgi:hypothetical protein